MTPTRSQRGLADVLASTGGTVRGLARGAREVPPEVAAWLERLTAVHVMHPLPEGWTRRAAA